jgi:CheY-like chemotaxis protein
VILFVDDNRELREALTEFLSLRGHVVQCAANGNEAVGLLARSEIPPDLVLLDLMMPELNGWGVLAELGKDPRLSRIPVVIMSGCRNVTQNAKEAGAVAVVRKPVEPQTLLWIIEHFEKRN